MNKLKTILKLKPFLKKYRLILLIGVIGVVLSSIISAPIPYITGIIIDKILIVKKDYYMLYIYSCIIVILYILRYVVSVVSEYMFAKVNSLVVNGLRSSVMDKIMDLPMDYLANTQKGYIQSRISECDYIGNLFSPSIINIILSIIDAIVSIVIMFSINYKLAILIVVLIPLYIFFSKVLIKKVTKNTQKILEANANLNGECFEIINGIEEIKILNGKEYHSAKFKDKLYTLIKNSIKQSKSIVLFTESVIGINNFIDVLVLIISGIMILNGNFTVGLYTSFSLYISKVFSSIQGISSVETLINPICVSIERLYEFLNMPDENVNKNKNMAQKIISIKLENVTFKYKGNTKDVIHGLSFEIKKGDKVLIKGKNGSGKSTIIRLLLGLYIPTNGNILYNNIDLNTINNKSLREKIGIVSQNVFLFRGTVLDNILYGQTKKNIQDVERLIKNLELEEYIKKFPNGLYTLISQNTVGISGGQSQVISFIRAMLSNKDVIILDEPISNVDDETRNIILSSLNKFKFEGILIIVSHLMENINFINKIIQIDTI